MRILFIFLLSLLQNITMAQIAEVKSEGNSIRVYKVASSGSSGASKSFYLGSSKRLLGYNNQYVIILESGNASIYDEDFNYKGYIRLGSDKEFLNITPTNILIKEGNMTRYYDFKGGSGKAVHN